MGRMKKTVYYPVTPGGTVCDWLESKTEDEAWVKLLKDAAHMPYENKQEFIRRGYEVASFTPD
jgi:hypothetical protein